MVPRRRMVVWATAAVVVVGLVALAAVLAQRERLYDRGFDTRVDDPAHRGDRPVVLYDEGHLNSHTADAAYRPFVDLMRNDGYEVRRARGPFSAEVLAAARVLVVVTARGANDANDEPAFAEAEIAAIDRWVRGGGSLLLVTDHFPYGAAAESLGRPFGIAMGKGLVEDAAHSDPQRGASHLVFERRTGLLRDHPIVRGRSASEEVRRILTFTGQSLLGPPRSVPFLALSEAAIEYPPTSPRVVRENGDVRVSMDYGDPVSASGRAQGIALEAGSGRVVVLGEAGMLRAQVDRDGSRVGMNLPGYDNRRLALNIVRWLSRVL